MDGTGLKTDTFKETGPGFISRFDGGNHVASLSAYWLCVVCPFNLNLWLQILSDRFEMFAVRGVGGGGSSVLLLPDVPALETKLVALVVLLFGLSPLGMVGAAAWVQVSGQVSLLCLRPQTDVSSPGY